ncbi:sugar phosphate isomerase/epimerase [Carboxylicivirga sediminis]|uniref:Sugar phosphate isomerase/epimerase n=1 Tax=Carboxylicivirga sediminis TaxID=2006564 RepID=A0A941IXT7_9BACT|nr:TIM barrel protein [Carboxylicivirga sediminis]MBR8535843.1 sugar phosphate isomerase/epimerase [Carboxylicivirga sediminis]
MKIKFFYPYWGSSHLSLEHFFERVKNAGFDGVEMNISFDEGIAEKIRQLLPQYELELIAQQWLESKDETPDEYIERMEEYFSYLASFNPLFINSHTGKDFYSFEENCRIFEAAERVGEYTGVKIVHETHRGRALFSTLMAKQYFNALPDLRINADFSHWCCVSESLLKDQNDIVLQACQRADFIHARVGYEQGPQINHLQSDNNRLAIETHLSWWKRILENAKLKGYTEFPVCTEFGPEPYLQTLPFSYRPVTDQWTQNIVMRDLLRDHLA